MSFLVSATFEPSELLHTFYGAPTGVWTQFDFPPPGAGSSRVNVSLAIYDKTATRLPEGLFLRLRPAASAAPPGGGSLAWRVSKLGQEVDVLVKGSEGVMEGGNQRQHGAVGGVSVMQQLSNNTSTQGGQGLFIQTGDAPLATFGDPTIFPVPTAAGSADPAFGLSIMLITNLWSTN